MDPNSVKPEFRFHRYELGDLTSVAPLVKPNSCGIYILEFANGDKYVGQSVNLTRRFSSHVHGSSHHEAWRDIEAISFVLLPKEELNRAEREVIAELVAKGDVLRNIVFNPRYRGPSKLDGVISIKDQKHWALGETIFDIESFQSACKRPRGITPKLFTNSVARRKYPLFYFTDSNEDFLLRDAFLSDIAAVLTSIPEAVRLEREFWTISDMPKTAGGRFFTLNVGFLEILYSPTSILEVAPGFEDEPPFPVVFLNLPSETFLVGNPELGFKVNSEKLTKLGEGLVYADRVKYSYSEFDCLGIRPGYLRDILAVSEVREPLQQLIVQLMRRSRVGLFRRAHSAELARLAFQKVAEEFSSGH